MTDTLQTTVEQAEPEAALREQTLCAAFKRTAAAHADEVALRTEGDRVRITARLVETSGETHLWADTYERHLTDCLSVQADIAARI